MNTKHKKPLSKGDKRKSLQDRQSNKDASLSWDNETGRWFPWRMVRWSLDIDGWDSYYE